MKNALLLTLALLVACGDGGSTGPVPDPISIATSSLPEGTVGVSYSMVLAASGGTGAYAWSVSSGALPAGLTLAANGAISGTPGTAGTSGFTVQATSGKQSATRGLSVNIQAPEVVITTGTLPGGSVGTAYSQTLAASGGSGGYAWTVASGALPAGLTLSAGGLLSGTPTASGASSFTVQVTSGARTATKSFALTIAFPAVGVTTTSLPDGTVGAAYEQILAASGGSGTYTWALTSGTLPAGLTLYASGTISGTPTAAGTSSFTVQAVSGTASAAKALTITVAQPAVTIATATLPDAEVGAAYNQTLTASGGLGSYTWTIASQSPPPGLTLSAAGVLSGTPTTAGTYTFSVRAVSGGQAEKSYTIIVQPPPVSITSGPALKVAVQNAPYADTLRAAGGTGSYTWSRTTGSLPAGLNLSGGGVISGTPTTQGTSTFTVQVTSGNRTASKDLTITVQPPTVTITTTTLAAGVVGDPYSQQLTATGGAGTVTWSLVSGSSLPPGLTLSSTGLITGTPGTQGTSTFTVRATSGAQEATRALSIVIGSAVPLVVISTAALPGGNVGEAYAATLAATGGTGVYVWSLASADTLPSGLALSASGQIAGTPARQGTSSFTVQVVSGTRTATMSLSITIGAALPDVLITTTTLPEGTVGTSYGQQLAATGGNGTYTWSRSSGDALPAGLTLSASGLLSGTPTVAGTSTFTVQASSGSRSDTQQLSITIAFAPVSITTASPLSNGMVNVAYSRQLAASGGTGTFTWALASGSSLPGGLGLSAGGLLSGTPTTAGSFNFTVQATSGAVSAAKAFALTIDAVPAVTVTTTTLSNATAGTAYSKQLTATGGLGTFTWTVSSGTLPAGLTLTSGGLLSGTPTAAGTGSFTVQASSGGQSDTQDLTLTVDAAAGSVIVLNVGSSATATVTAGQNIVIPVNVDLSQRGAENLASLTVRMAWDTARFTYASSSAGNWVDSNGDPASYTNNLSTAASGYVTLGGYTAEATTASFTLRTITLTARSTASQVTSAVTASNIVAGNASGQPITVTPRNLTVTVNP